MNVFVRYTYIHIENKYFYEFMLISFILLIFVHTYRRYINMYKEKINTLDIKHILYAYGKLYI